MQVTDLQHTEDYRIDRYLDAAKKHLTDLVALESHVRQAVQMQLQEDAIHKDTGATRLLIDLDQMLARHVEGVEQVIAAFGTSDDGTIKRLTTEALGKVAGLLGKLREHTLTRILRDDYTALSLIAMAYTTLNAFALTFDETELAELAAEHLRETTDMIMRLSEIIPAVTVAEVCEENNLPYNAEAVRQAVKQTQAAWSPDYELVS